MSEYIRRSSVVEFLKERCRYVEDVRFPVDLSTECHAIADSVSDPNLFPSEDVAPVKRGVWHEVTEHDWRRDAHGEIDERSFEREFHNGVTCNICNRSKCVHCEPDYLAVQDCIAHYKCSECGAHEHKEYPFCHCGARMTSESFVKEGIEVM